MASKRKFAEPTFPNAGVEAWYRDELQRIVLAMSKDMLARVKRAWAAAVDPVVADAAPRKAAGIVFRYRDQVLLLHRTDGLGWALPGGGVEDGETYQQAARRECLEEMRYIYDGPLSILDVQKGLVRYVTFEAHLWERFTPKLNPEHDHYTWARPDLALVALGAQIHPGVRETLHAMVQADVAMDAKAPRPSIGPLLRRAMTSWSTLWTRRLDALGPAIAREFASKSTRATTVSIAAKLAKAGFTVKFQTTPAATAVLDAVIGQNVGLIRSIPQKFLSDVEVQVWEAVMSGSDLDTLSRNIHAKYGVAWRRAALIAMDQNAKAKAAMERARRIEVGITKARWRHSHAGVDKRPSHVKAGKDGVIYDVAQGWWDPDEQKYIWPGVLLHCRCFDEPVIPGFD